MVLVVLVLAVLHLLLCIFLLLFHCLEKEGREDREGGRKEGNKRRERGRRGMRNSRKKKVVRKGDKETGVGASVPCIMTRNLIN